MQQSAYNFSVIQEEQDIDILVNQIRLTVNLTKYIDIYTVYLCIYKAPITEVAELILFEIYSSSFK